MKTKLLYIFLVLSSFQQAHNFCITQNIVNLEYFFDSDPGFGNGNIINITGGDSLVDINLSIDISNLSNGFHKLFVRVQDENGRWSFCSLQDIFKIRQPDPLPDIKNLVAAEYFIDNDPGYGNGNPLQITENQYINQNYEIDISNIDVGMHYLFVRVKDNTGKWSFSTFKPFCIKGFQLFLEGAYDTIQGKMLPLLNEKGLIPLHQPFNSNQSAGWYYNGNEYVDSIPNQHIIDWVLIQARDADDPSNATQATVKETKAVFLLDNGKITELDGYTPAKFNTQISNNLYVVVFHRNHLGVITAFPVDTSSNCGLTYNFSANENEVLGGQNGYKEIALGVWGLVAGDGDGNGNIDFDDINIVWKNNAGKSGYRQADSGMDGQVDNTDKNNILIKNIGKVSAVPD